MGPHYYGRRTPAPVVSFLLGGLLMRLTYLVYCILRVTPSFLCGTLCLIGNSLIRHFLIANGFADALLNLANDLIDLRNLVKLLSAFVFGPPSWSAVLYSSSASL